jgi:hypothetical protein
MENIKTPKFEVINGGNLDKDKNVKELEKTLKNLIDEYSCNFQNKGNLFIFGNDHLGNRGILYWIKECEEEKIKAKQIVKIINSLNGQAEVLPASKYNEYADLLVEEAENM